GVRLGRMSYASLRAAIEDLEQTGQLVRIGTEIDPHLDAAEIQRRVYQAQGPAILFERLRGCRFPAVSNLFGTIDRTRFLFRHSLDRVRRLVELKIDPAAALRRPFRYAGALPSAWSMRPKFVAGGSILENETTISQLPAIQSWPADGGPF